MRIGSKEIGDGHPTYVIAEACDNHMGDTAVAREMVRGAKAAGADAIKFQHHLPDEEMLPDVPMSDNFDEPLYQFLQKYALTLEQHAELKAYCDEVGIEYLCTPFSLKAAQEINTLPVPAFKIGSGEMTDIPTLMRIADIGRPMIISTGMSTLEEIDRTYSAIRAKDVPIALMNCTSEYPPDYADLNLGVIRVLYERYPDAIIGHSDHTPDLYTSFAATALGARIIEKHIILDPSQPGPDQAVSIDMPQLAELCDGIRKINQAMGTDKVVHEKESAIREWAFRSVVALQDIERGQRISEGMIWSKRPGTGIPSHRMNEVIGAVARRDIARNSLVRWSDLERDG